jgi:hypothetical protein
MVVKPGNITQSMKISREYVVSSLQVYWVTWNFRRWLNSIFKLCTDVPVQWGAIPGSAETTFLWICIFLHNAHEIAGQKRSINQRVNIGEYQHERRLDYFP